MTSRIRLSAAWRTALLLPVLALAASALRAAEDTPAWITKSNANAQVLLDALNKFQPEGASQTGFPEYDGQVADLGPRITERCRGDRPRRTREASAQRNRSARAPGFGDPDQVGE